MTFEAAGLSGMTQRIEQIQQQLAALDGAPVTAAPNSNSGAAFEQLLNDRISPDSPSGNPTTPQNTSGLEAMIDSQASSIGLDPSLAKAVTKAESGFNPQAVSKAGAQGLMQLMPATAQGLGVQSLLDPVQNVKGGTQYLKSLMDKYHNVPNAVAAYNAGPGAVDKYGGVPPYAETQQYVKRVLAYQQQYQQQQPQEAP